MQEIKTAKPFSGLPATLQAKLSGRGPQKAPPKVSTTIRLSPDVVQTFWAAGDGWQTRIDAALKDWPHRPQFKTSRPCEANKVIRRPDGLEVPASLAN